MFAVQPEEKVLGFLGRALSLELSAVQQYSTQARLVASWGLGKAADSFSKEAREELQHVDRIIERMLAVGVAPNASQLRPVKIGSDLSALLKIDQQFEAEIIHLYQMAVRHCATAGDHDSRVFFEELLNEEQQHLVELTDWLNRIQQVSAERVNRTL